MDAKVRRFEESEVWQDARKVTFEIYKLTDLKPFAQDAPLRDQIRRSAVSIMANIAEGSERGTTKEFIYFLGIALGSTAEVRSHLYIASDLGYLNNDKCEKLIMDLNRIVRQLKGLRRSLAKLPSSASSSASASASKT